MDYTKLNGPDLLHEMGIDGDKWAEAFCQLNPDANVDEITMLGWFCSAIMHTLDTERGTVINGEHAEYLLSRYAGANSDKRE